VESVEVAASRTPQLCDATQILAFIGTRWTPAVIYYLHHGVKRYGELQRSMPGISPKTLAERLQALDDFGLVTRIVHPDRPPRVEYLLTPRGHQLGDILEGIAEWATTGGAPPVPPR
jgi:DNA-binding HxlR family transcriptional regulator